MTMPLPPEDRALSPHTGWTRAHWEAVADGLLAGVAPHFSPARAQIRLPGRASWSDCDGLEGFARTFLLAAFRVAGGGDPALLAPYGEGMAAGADPGHAEAWQPIADRTQPMVEAASIAIGLQLTREHLWERLSPGVRDSVAGWLGGALRHAPVDNNWWLFPVAVGDFLRSAGRDEEAAGAAVERGLARIERWYLGDGWYTDGPARNLDHYNGWAMHLYPALHVWLTGAPAEPYGSRLREFLSGYGSAFDVNGSPVYQGRSVTYRFAAAAPLWLGAMLGVSPLAPGATRRLASGALRHFLDNGALTDGLLSLGWHGPHGPSLQDYSGSASPYWAAKGFAGLLLPADHPVWTAVEEPGPGDGAAGLPGPGLLVHRHGGVVRLVNHGTDHQPLDGDVLPDDPLYARSAYSTRTGPSLDVPDNHVGLVLDGRITSRGRLTPLGAGPDWAASSHRPVPGALIESLSVVHGPVEARVHRVTAPAGTPVRQTGWAVVPGDGLSSVLLGVAGFAEAEPLLSAAGTVFGAPARIPVLEAVTSGETTVLACAAVLGPDPAGEGDAPVLDVRADHATLTWPDGAVHRIALSPSLAVVPS
ncbi:DUF2264 domain-containing protein [Streptosporangium sp. NPDC003464]